MDEEIKGFIRLEAVPGSCVEQAIISFLSPLMSSPSRETLSEALKAAPCVLIDNLPMEVGQLFVRMLKSLGAQVGFSTRNGKSERLSMDKG